VACRATQKSADAMPEPSMNDDGLERFRDEVSVKVPPQLRELAEIVFTSHANRSTEEVLAELMKQAEASGYDPSPEALHRVAEAISAGKIYHID
jgi:hypothetical protein